MDLDESQASVSSQADPKNSPTFGRDGSFHIREAVGSASISPSGRDIALGSPEGLHIIDLDNPWSPPRTLSHRQPWEVADVQWSPFASRDYWVVSTSNQKALVWNLDIPTTKAPIQHVLHGHSRAITDINFSAHDPDMLATCGVDSFIQCWDLRHPKRPAMTFADWYAGASQVKWNRQDSHILAAAHDRFLHIWDTRKGSQPLRTIFAHSTKIYGIDWNRINPNKILTCSLDMSIKLWDYSNESLLPEHTIRTSYPVWRARHTPCGDGVLAMPQRGGENALHLYKRDITTNDGAQSVTSPVKSFLGHTAQVKEFLWRTQGTMNDAEDEREFQLVSWGTDNNLLLHRVDDSVMDSIGYRKGQIRSNRIRFTRKGATYRTFHDPPAPKVAPSHGLSSLFKGTGQQGFRAQLGKMDTYGSDQNARGSVSRRKGTDPILWLKGVKIGASVTEGDRLPDQTSSSLPPWATAESLADEIASVGEKYKKVKFEEVKISERQAKFSLDGPWGLNENLVHIRVRTTFPEEYPGLATPGLVVENTSTISNAALKRLSLEVQSICDAYSDIGRGSLEAIVCYLIGDWDAKTALGHVERLQAAMKVSLERIDGDSSSDDEDGIPGPHQLPPPSQGFRNTDIDTGSVNNANANVPLPKACGALWADDGRLVCFFPRPTEPDPLYITNDYGSTNETARKGNSFEGFGVFAMPRSRKRTRPTSVNSDSSSDSDDTMSTSSTISSDESDTSESIGPGPPSLHDLKQSVTGSVSLDQISVRNTSAQKTVQQVQQVVSVKVHDALLPSKQSLAERYIVFGSSDQVCSHNEEVARDLGFGSLADIWALLKLILRREVPLLTTQHPLDHDADVISVARRVAVHIRRRDGGPHLVFDAPDYVTAPDIYGAVHWGYHPYGPGGMVERLFDHFEALADIQMLAMLSCLFEPWPQNKVARPYEKAAFDLAPSNGHAYFNTLDEAIAVLRPPEPKPQRGRFDTGIANFEQDRSGDADIAVWTFDEAEDERQGSLRSGDPPSPELERRHSHASTIEHSGSSSPEETFLKRSQSMLSSRFAASFSRPFSFMTSASASPPSQSHTPELSTSAPSAGYEGPGSDKNSMGRQHRSFDDSGSLYRVESRSSLGHEMDVESVPSSASSESGSDDDWEHVVTLREFSGSGHGELLPHVSWKHASRFNDWIGAYAHMLMVWQLPFQRAEVLKFIDMREPTAPHGPGKTAKKEVCCTVCQEAITSLSSACLQCGHAAHAGCLSLIAGEESSQMAGCAFGCYCACSAEAAPAEVDHSTAQADH